MPPLTLRVIDREGSPWFLAKDVCAVLGLNPNKLNGSLQDHMRRLASDEYAAEVVPMLGNHRKAYLLGESGLYALILRSDKPEAGQFRKWVTSVVLPAIRKDGAYVMGEEKVLTGEMSDTEVLSIDGVESNGPRTQWRTLHISHGE